MASNQPEQALLSKLQEEINQTQDPNERLYLDLQITYLEGGNKKEHLDKLHQAGHFRNQMANYDETLARPLRALFAAFDGIFSDPKMSPFRAVLRHLYGLDPFHEGRELVATTILPQCEYLYTPAGLMEVPELQALAKQTAIDHLEEEHGKGPTGIAALCNEIEVVYSARKHAGVSENFTKMTVDVIVAFCCKYIAALTGQSAFVALLKGFPELVADIRSDMVTKGDGWSTMYLLGFFY